MRLNKINCIIKVFILFLMVSMIFSGCSRLKNSTSFSEDDSRLKIVTTIFPYYDFVRQIAGDKAEIVLAVPAGMDTHSFEPTAADMINFGRADLIIYNGGEMEGWVNEVIEAASNDDIIAEEMMNYVDTVVEEIVEGMEPDKHEHSEEEDIHEEEEYDEHIWTSPKNAIRLVKKIVEIISDADSENAEFYKENGNKYIEKLARIDKSFMDIVKSSNRRYIIFGDRFPLRYFVEEYGLTYSAAFAGCSADTEPSADTIAYLIDSAKKEEVPVILKIELTSPRVADIIAEETDAEVMTFYTCHNVTREQFNNGITYYDLMRENVEVLKEALRGRY